MRFRFIDALRGIAALAVLFCHLPDLGSLHDYLSWGRLGVPVFFVISGFVIAASNADQALTANYIGRFILRRSLRLDPPYWMMMLIVIAFGTSLSFADTLGNMFYLHRILNGPIALSVSWTLCQEVQLYLFFILSMALCQKVVQKTGGNALVTGMIALAVVAVLSVFTTHLFWREFFVPYWYQFFAGVVAFWCVSRRLHWGFGAGYLALVSARLYGDPAAVTVVLTAALLLTLRERMTTLGSSRVPQFFGRISYSLYLTHMPVCAVLLEQMDPGPLRPAVLVVGSLVAAVTMYYLIERTALGWSARVAKTAPPPAKAPAAATLPPPASETAMPPITMKPAALAPPGKISFDTLPAGVSGVAFSTSAARQEPPAPVFALIDAT